HHEFLELITHRVGRRLLIATHHVREHALPRLAVCARSAARTVGELHLAPTGAVHDTAAYLLRQLAPRRVRIELIVLGQAGDDGLAQMPGRFTPRQDDTLEQRDDRIPNDECGADLATRAETAASVARAVGRVERELSRLQLGHARAAVNARVALAEQVRLLR